MTDKPDMKSRPVRAGETPLDANLGHRYLDVLREGGEAFDNRTASPYSGHSLEHCLHATGWVQRDLRVALDRVLVEREATEARHAAELRELKERFSEVVTDWFGRYSAEVPPQFQPFILPAPDPLVDAVGDALEGQGMGRPSHTTTEITAHLRAAIEARGGKIVWEAK